MSLFSDWSGSDAWGSRPTLNTSSSSTASLSFLITAATSGLQTYSYAQIGLNQRQVGIAGLGAASVVQIGTLYNGKLVAVKVDRNVNFQLFDPPHFESYLSRLTLEMRILSNDRVKRHNNLLDIMGFGIHESGGEPSFFLVEEYSRLGDLKAFLRSCPSLSVQQQLRFCLDIAEALEVLHSLKVCHGDVKLENALVFETDNERGRLVKLSDFSHAIVASESDPEGPVTLGFGTPLLRAPELDNGSASRERCFNIAAAIKTDTFSFGLFLWEVFKLGLTYFDDSWLPCSIQSRSTHGLEAKEAFLSTMSHDAFWALAEAFLEGLKDLNDVSLQTVRLVFKETLQYEPAKRGHIGDIAEILRQSWQSIDKHQPIDVLDRIQPSDADVQIFTPTTHESLFEILDSGFRAGLLLDDLPPTFRHQVVSNLKHLSCIPSKASASHANAAMALSECYTVGYGVNHDMKSMLHWLYQAASAGSRKATAWYNRICITVGSSPLPLENAATYEDYGDSLSGIPAEDYLHARIQQLELARRTEARMKFEELFSGDICLEQRSVELATFHHLQIDVLNPVHVAAWLGLDSVIDKLAAASSQVNLISKLGRTPVFYACLGGHLSTLRSLIRSGGNVDQRDLLGIAPLHLCVFFSRHAVEDAVSLLVEQGANPNAAMNSTLEWGEHDITLQGAPMEWAVRCRHSQLVQALLHTAADVRGLNTAIELFFWEIADLLLLQKAWNDEEPPQLALSPIERPYRHWIAHGKDHLHTVSWTLDILEKHGLDFDRHFEELGGSTLLMVTISGSQTIDDFEIVRQLAKRGKNVKFANGYGFTALGNVMLRSGNKESWTETLQHLLTYYDTSELEQNYLFEGSYLHSAVSSDSVVGARELLRKGVDVNQPTYDSLQNTPLQICVLQDGSPEMMTLLLQHGANIEPSGGDLILSPLENRLLGLQTTSHLLDLLLEHRSSEQSCLHALHVALNNALICLDDTRKDAQEVFRHMIAKPAVQSFISDANPGEATLLHRAVAALNPYFTKLLLEAGADVMVSANIAGEDLVPLQVALGNGKFCWETHASMSQSTTVLCEQYERSRRAAFETTCLLLSEHTALENGGFEGITPLHLAAYMGIAVVVERLTATPGIDKEAKGSWPGQEGLLTPVQLLAATLIQDAFGYPFVGLFWHVNEQLQSLPSANRKYVPRQRTEGHNLYFHDLKDVQIKTGGGSEARFLLPPTLIYSPRLIYNNASQVAGLLGYKLSPSV